MVELLQSFKLEGFEEIHNEMNKIAHKYKLNYKENGKEISKEGYLKLRNEYNKSPYWLEFYALVTCSFGNQIRFNSNGMFNMPYGERYYNKSLQNNLKIFIEQLNNKDCYFKCHDFRELKPDKLDCNDYVYVDPPYYSSIATYNENGGWTERDERELLNLLDILHSRGIKFGLSNNLKYDNPHLDKWKDKYNVHYLNMDYGNCNYQKKDKSKDVEVFITNY